MKQEPDTVNKLYLYLCIRGGKASIRLIKGAQG